MYSRGRVYFPFGIVKVVVVEAAHITYKHKKQPFPSFSVRCSVCLKHLFFQNQAMHRTVKPTILSTFGDIAIAIGPAYAKYLEPVVHILQQASLVNFDKV